MITRITVKMTGTEVTYFDGFRIRRRTYKNGIPETVSNWLSKEDTVCIKVQNNDRIYISKKEIK